MKKEYHGYKYEITPSGERYEIRVWTPHADTRAPGISLVGSPRTAEAAERMAKDWIIHDQEGRQS